MKINVLTLFPEMFGAVTEDSILGRANNEGLVKVNLINIRDFSEDKHRKVDDTPFGGGVGMLMACQPCFDALRSVERPGRIIYMSPRGRLLDKALITELAGESELTILAGHYEGIDQRIIDGFGMEEISIGDYVLTGGELAAMVLIDAVARLVPGVLGTSESATDESIYSGLLEADQYTKPREYAGQSVPEVLVNGNHKEIAKWQLLESIRLTAERRPDLFEKWARSGPDFSEFTKAERKEMEALIKSLLDR